jgi:tight adherence protein B
MEQTIPIFVFFFVLLVCLGVYFLYKDRQAVKKELLIKRASTKRSIKEIRRIDLRRRRERSRTERIFSFLIDIPQLGDLLSQSGINLSLDIFLFIATGVAALFAFIAIIAFRSFLPFLAMLSAGFAVPILFLMHKKKKRDAAVVEQLPDVLDFMVRALRSGQSLDNAFYGVSANFPDPIGGEIRIVYEEISLGLAFTEALKNFESRFSRLPEIRFLCTSFVIQKETGGNLTEILDGLSSTIRQRFKLIRQVKATSAEGRLSVLFLGILPFAFGFAVYVLNPAYITKLFVDPAGHKLLFLALVLDVAGFMVMRIMTKVDV